MASDDQGPGASVESAGELRQVDIEAGEEEKRHFIVLRESMGPRQIRMYVPSSQWLAVSLALGGMRPPRPLTHDLFHDAIQLLGGAVVRVVVNDLKMNTFRARLVLRQNERDLELDSRPSDAIAVALCARAPVYATDAVLDAKIDCENADAG
jgi:bifunctional DNase/RNase